MAGSVLSVRFSAICSYWWVISFNVVKLCEEVNGCCYLDLTWKMCPCPAGFCNTTNGDVRLVTQSQFSPIRGVLAASGGQCRRLCWNFCCIPHLAETLISKCHRWNDLNIFLQHTNKAVRTAHAWWKGGKRVPLPPLPSNQSLTAKWLGNVIILQHVFDLIVQTLLIRQSVRLGPHV